MPILNCPKNIEDKFVFLDKSYSVLVTNQGEIDVLKKFLGFDFLKYEQQKLPYERDLTKHFSEFIVSCKHKESVVTHYDEKRWFGYWIDFNEYKREALPLDVFLDPQNNLKYFWTHHARLAIK